MKINFDILMKRLSKYDKEKVSCEKKKFHCNDCDCQTNDNTIFNSHGVSFHHEKKAKCHICEKTLAKDYLDRHIKLTHEFCHQVFCRECKKKFTNEFYLKEHFIRVHGSDEQQNLKPQMTKPSDKQKRFMKYKCTICDFTSNKKVFFELHNSRTHSIRLSCDVCGFDADTSGALKSHMTTHKSRLSFNCSLCSFKGSTKQNLENHWKNKHEIGKEIKCNDCNAVYSSKDSLKMHTNTVHKKLRYRCEICNYEATQATHLLSHKKSIHQGVKYPCNDCGKEFTQRSHMKTHVNTVHLGKTKLECTICEYKSYHSIHLRNHMNAVHLGVKYPCTECDHKATQKSSLKAHMKVKHFIGEFHCKLCTAKFAKPQLRNEHVLKSHGSTYLQSRNKYRYISSKNSYDKEQATTQLGLEH